ncbi:hypothetical protein [Nocardioides sp.]|uniref:hypothetical protein n=1 Tax=Nocardioides sp. TaxID=35761 RepID=UPI002B26BB99|nr:hypothetical protein [Nocardioides sp.]
MTTIVLSSTITARAVHRCQADNVRLDQWQRVGFLAMSLTDQHGHARMATGQIGRELGLSVNQVSDAIATARNRGLLDPASHARCLVLVGCASNPCEENHRYE